MIRGQKAGEWESQKAREAARLMARSPLEFRLRGLPVSRPICLSFLQWEVSDTKTKAYVPTVSDLLHDPKVEMIRYGTHLFLQRYFSPQLG